MALAPMEGASAATDEAWVERAVNKSKVQIAWYLLVSLLRCSRTIKRLHEVHPRTLLTGLSWEISGKVKNGSGPEVGACDRQN